jgi:ankyrin repeat protein
LERQFTEKDLYSYAVKDEQMTSWLLDHGANPNKRCGIDCIPLSYAVQLAPISVIELMLSHGGDVSKGQLLQYAIFRDTDVNEVITMLVDRGAPLNAAMHEDGHTLMRFWPMSLGTPLHIAAELGRTDAIRYLVNLGADTSVKDANGRTVAELAQQLNQTEVVRLLGSKL